MKTRALVRMPALLALVSSSALFAQTLEVDWLYFSSNGSWISRTETLSNSENNLHLPVENLSASQFWWQADNANTQVVWAQPDPMGLPKVGAPVEIDGIAGLWLIKDVSASHLVLQQGKNVRYWPQSQWHLLNWTSSLDYGMSLTVLQPEKTKNTLFYAWQTPDLSAQVRYRLDDTEGAPSLYQELIVSNLSDSDYAAPGYSFAQASGQPPMLARTMSLEMSDMAIKAPEASQSQGVPTLISKQPIQIQAGSHVWLPVSQTPLNSVERLYSVQWDSRQQGLQQTQSSLKLTAKQSLPDLAGPVKIGVFDQQIALLESYYQPSSAKEAVLNLGQSSLVSLTSKQVREGQWKLTVDNRSNEPATVELTVSHWNGKISQQIPMTVRVSANDSKSIELELVGGSTIKLAK